MTPYGKIKMESGEDIFFEIDDEDYDGKVSDRGIALGLQERFESVMNLVKETAESTHKGIKDIKDESRPSAYEISFGMKFSANAGVVFAKVGSEGNFQVKLTWTAKQ